MQWPSLTTALVPLLLLLLVCTFFLTARKGELKEERG